MMAASLNAQTITLDLTKSTTELTFDSENGAWTGTFDQAQEVIESQSFIFIHNCNPDWYTWWGFTASNSADNSRRKSRQRGDIRKPEVQIALQPQAFEKIGYDRNEHDRRSIPGRQHKRTGDPGKHTEFGDI